MYATRSDMEELYGVDEVALVATRHTEDAPSNTSIERALADASALIDSHIAAHYPLPLVSPAPVLVRPCVDIALYYLAQSATRLTDELRQRYEDAMALMRRYSNGTATLGLDRDGDGKVEGGAKVISVTGPARQFTREKLRDL
jgi:phage gp36-like protein